MKFRNRSVAREGQSASGGFTLMELLVGIAILAILGIGIASAVNTNDSKSVKLVDSMREVSNGLLRAQMDMGGFPSRLTVLMTKAEATSSNMYTGQSGVNTWNGPYVAAVATDSSSNITLDAISEGITISIAREAGINYSRMYYLHADNIPNGIVSAALQKCNGSSAITATFANAQCRGTLGTGTAEVGTLDLKVVDTN